MSNHEDADVLICILSTKPLAMPDNLVGHCCLCHRLVQFRPHVPKLIKRMCIACARKDVLKHPDSEFVVTPESMQELLEFRRRKRRH